MKHTFYFILLFGLSSALFSQKKAPGYKEYFMEGSYLLLEDEPELALLNFKKAYAFDSTSSNINYMLGIACLLSSKHKAEAEYYLQKSVANISGKYKSDNSKEKSAPPLSHFYYGKALHFNYKFDQALKEYAAFKPSINPKDLEYVKMLAREELSATTAKNLTNFPLNVKITNLGDAINSEYPEYSPVFSADERTLIYTTRRPTLNGLQDREGNYYEDIVVSYKDDAGNWSKPVPLGINTMGHEACINLSADGQTLLVYKNEAGGSNPLGNGNIYYAEYNGKNWDTLKEFGSDVNSIYMESHACLSADGNLLFFSSERPGGFGGKDIYRCIKLPNGKWSKALNMGPRINSEYDEDGGFIHPDGQTFYFASNGPGTMGGYDVLYATLNEDNKFSNVTNIGYPVNTTDDDIFYVVSPDGKRGYFASTKEGGYGDKDIYEITLEEKREVFLALFKGQILPAEGETLPEDIQIVVKDKESGEVIGISRPKLENGTFSTILPPGKEYNLSYQVNNGEEFYNEDIYVSNEYAYQEYKRAVNLEPVKIKGRVTVVQNTVKVTTQVLDDDLHKQPVRAARVVMVDSTGTKQVFTTNDEGKTEYNTLTVDKTYSITADVNDQKSETKKLSTAGVKVAESLTQVVYMKENVAPEPSKQHVLDLLVKHPKTRKGIKNANVTLTDPYGSKQEFQTDEKGRLTNVYLIPGMKYKVLAYKDNIANEEEVFTAPTRVGKFNKNIYLAYSPPSVNLATQRDSSGKRVVLNEQFEYHYGYGQYAIDVNSDAFKSFVDEIEGRLKEKGRVTIEIVGSASKVPMRANGGNPQLAANRANGLQDLLQAELAKRSTTASGLSFEIRSVVSGPEYQGDYLVNRKTYEKFQYAKAKIK
jgi:hypothetical protein